MLTSHTRSRTCPRPHQRPGPDLDLPRTGPGAPVPGCDLRRWVLLWWRAVSLGAGLGFTALFRGLEW